MMQDYLLPESPMSWKEAWDIYFVENAGALFNDLARYGLRMPKYHEVATAEAEHLVTKSGAFSIPIFTRLRSISVCQANKKMNWLSEKYPIPSINIIVHVLKCGVRWKHKVKASITWAYRNFASVPEIDGLY